MGMGQRLRQIIGDSFGAEVVEYQLEKALQEVKERASSPMTTFYDPMSVFLGTGNWLYKASAGLTFRDLRNMAKNPVIASIIQTRKNQVSAFAHPQRSAYEYGFKIMSDDKKAEKESATTQEISSFMYEAGIPGYGEESLEVFLRKFVDDSLVLDQACSEIVYRKNGTPAYFVAVDGATIRRTKESLQYAVPANSKKPWYVQVINERIMTEYTPQELIFGVRNPQTDIRSAGYGFSELEYLVRILTGLIANEKYNVSQLAQGGTAKGVLVVKGDAGRDEFRDFKRDFRTAIRAAADYWSPPVLQVSEKGSVDWLQLDRSNRDIEYAKLFDFLVKVACGVYQISPEEINWSIGNTGTTTTFESRSSDKVATSKDKGLGPLLTFCAVTLTRNIVQRIDERYRIEFVGMDSDRKGDADRRAIEVKTYKTVDEVRAEDGMKPMPDGKGSVILDAGWMAREQAEQAAADQAAASDPFAMFGEGQKSLVNVHED